MLECFPKPRANVTDKELDPILDKFVIASAELVRCYFPDADRTFLKQTLPDIVFAVRDAMNRLIEMAELANAVGK